MSGPKQGTVTRLPVKTDSYQARCLPLTFAQLGRGSKGEGDEDENENDDDGWVLLTPIETPPLLPKIQAAPIVQTNSTSSSSSEVKIKSRSKKTNKKPAETPHFPFSSSVDDTLLQEEDFENRER